MKLHTNSGRAIFRCPEKHLEITLVFNIGSISEELICHDCKAMMEFVDGIKPETIEDELVISS